MSFQVRRHFDAASSMNEQKKRRKEKSVGATRSKTQKPLQEYFFEYCLKPHRLTKYYQVYDNEVSNILIKLEAMQKINHFVQYDTMMFNKIGSENSVML